MATITKGQIQRQDIDNYDGTLATSRTDATGGTLSGLKVGNWVDVLSIYGAGDTANMTDATISAATGGLGSANVALVFAPGTWVISNDLTIASNFTVVAPAGCIFAPAAGKTLTIAGVFDRHHATYSGGSGTVTISGTDLMATSINTADYAVDTGAADAYAIAVTPSITSYVAGRQFRFKATNTNTGASTLNVNSVGAKSIKQADGSTALSAGDITAGQIVTVNYEGVDDEFHLVPTQQSPANPAATDAENTFTQTQIFHVGADVASAAALPVDVAGTYHDVTGTATITSLNTEGVGALKFLEFDGALTLTHHSSDLVIPGGDNFVTKAGDIIPFYEYASGDWRAISLPPHRVQIGATQTASASSSINFTSVIDSTYDRYMVVCNGVRPATNSANLLLRVSISSSLKTDATYEYHTAISASTASTYAGIGGSTNSSLVIAQGMSNATDDNGSFIVFLHEPSNTAHNKILTWKGGYTGTTPSVLRADGSGAYFGSVAAIDGLGFLMNTGNIAEGDFTLYGLR